MKQRNPTSIRPLTSPVSVQDYHAILQALHQSQYQQAFLLRLNDQLGPIADPVEIQNVAACILGEQLQADRTYYAWMQGDYETAVIEREYKRGKAPSVVGRHALADFESARAAYQAGRSLITDDVREDPAVPAADLPAFQALAIRALVSVPLVKNGRTVASMTVLKAQPHHWTPQEIALVEETAERTWAAVERARVEEALRKSETEFRTVSEAAPALVWVCSPAGENIYFNQRWYDYTGQTAEQASGYGWTTTMHPEDVSRILPYWQRCQQTGEPYEGEVRYRRHDGVYRWHIFRGLPRRTMAGQIEAWYGS